MVASTLSHYIYLMYRDLSNLYIYIDMVLYIHINRYLVIDVYLCVYVFAQKSRLLSLPLFFILDWDESVLPLTGDGF